MKESERVNSVPFFLVLHIARQRGPTSSSATPAGLGKSWTPEQGSLRFMVVELSCSGCDSI